MRLEWLGWSQPAESGPFRQASVEWRKCNALLWVGPGFKTQFDVSVGKLCFSPFSQCIAVHMKGC